MPRPAWHFRSIREVGNRQATFSPRESVNIILHGLRRSRLCPRKRSCALMQTCAAANGTTSRTVTSALTTGTVTYRATPRTSAILGTCGLCSTMSPTCRWRIKAQAHVVTICRSAETDTSRGLYPNVRRHVRRGIHEYDDCSDEIGCRARHTCGIQVSIHLVKFSLKTTDFLVFYTESLALKVSHPVEGRG